MPKKQAQALTWEYENSFGQNAVVCGTDEAGRGPLAGRVYAAAVILDQGDKDDETVLALNDSKKLTEKRRFELEPEIKNVAVSWCVAYSTVEEIETDNILSSSLHAMRRAIDGLCLDRSLSDKEKSELCVEALGGRPQKPDFALVDGNVSKGFLLPVVTVVGGDGKSPSIAAASILAKTARDTYCIEYLEKKFPGYGFAVHKGYGTKAHYEAVSRLGLCEEHRRSFFAKNHKELL